MQSKNCNVIDSSSSLCKMLPKKTKIIYFTSSNWVETTIFVINRSKYFKIKFLFLKFLFLSFHFLCVLLSRCGLEYADCILCRGVRHFQKRVIQGVTLLRWTRSPLMLGGKLSLSRGVCIHRLWVEQASRFWGYSGRVACCSDLFTWLNRVVLLRRSRPPDMDTRKQDILVTQTETRIPRTSGDGPDRF